MKLKWWHKELARDVVLGMGKFNLLKNWKKWNLTEAKLNNYLKDPDFIAECEDFRNKLDDKAAKSLLTAKLRAKMLVGEKVMDIVDRILSKKPYNPETREGDIDYDEGITVKLAMDFLKEMKLGNIDENAEQKIEIQIVSEKKKEEEE
jgi:hypothetical protein